MRILTFIAIYFTCNSLQAQDKLNALTAPTSPASSVLGMQPSVILSPKSYRAMEAALFSNFSDESGNGTIPDDFGLEFTPYWVAENGITLEEYLLPKNTWNQLWRNSSFSLASTQSFLLQDSTKTKSIAFGYRTSIFFGSKKDYSTVLGYIDSLSKNQKVGSYIMSKFIEISLQGKISAKEDYLALIRLPLTDRIFSVLGSVKESEVLVESIYAEARTLTFSSADPDSFFLAFTTIIEQKMKGSYEEFKKYITDRQGLSIDAAYGMFINFPENEFNYSEVPRQSIWLTPSYNFDDKLNFLKVSTVFRYQWYNTRYFEKYFPEATVYDHNLDFGIAVAGEFKKFSIQFEGTARNSKSLSFAGTNSEGNSLYLKRTDSDFQYIGTLSYRLTEQIALTYQIGSGFKPVFTGGETLISMLSLNFGFGGPNFSDVEK